MAVPLIVAGTLVSAYGAVRAGQAQAAASKFNAQVATQNAQVAQQQADAEAQEKRREKLRRLGSMQAAYGAAGVTSDSGSVLDVLGDSIRQGTLDELTAKYNGQLRAAGYTNTASLDNFQGSNALTSGYLDAAGTMLNGSAKAYGVKYQNGG